jgi:hypothetical protein
MSSRIVDTEKIAGYMAVFYVCLVGSLQLFVLIAGIVDLMN